MTIVDPEKTTLPEKTEIPIPVRTPGPVEKNLTEALALLNDGQRWFREELMYTDGEEEYYCSIGAVLKVRGEDALLSGAVHGWTEERWEHRLPEASYLAEATGLLPPLPKAGPRLSGLYKVNCVTQYNDDTEDFEVVRGMFEKAIRAARRDGA